MPAIARGTTYGIEAQVKGRPIFGSEVLAPELDMVRWAWRTLVWPASRESSCAVCILLGVNATLVSQLLVIASSRP